MSAPKPLPSNEGEPFNPVTYHLCRSNAFLGHGTIEACKVQDDLARRLASPEPMARATFRRLMAKPLDAATLEAADRQERVGLGALRLLVERKWAIWDPSR